MQTEDKIKSWLMQFPGLVVAHSPQAVLREAMALFTKQTGTECDLPIFTEADDRSSLKEHARDAVRCHFDEGEGPKVIWLHF